MGYQVLLKNFPRDREFPKAIESQKGLTSALGLEKWHYAKLAFLHFQVATHVLKDCFCATGKSFLELLVYLKNKQSTEYFIWVLNLSLTATLPILAFKCHDLQCYQYFVAHG